MKRWMSTITAGAALCALGSGAQAELVVMAEYDAPVNAVGLGFDSKRTRVWLYGSFAAQLNGYDAGGALPTIVRPGESANDADVEIAPKNLVLGSTNVPSGAVLFINGESGSAEIYAIDRVSGSVIATLATAFGASHVVGGAYHPARNTFFLVQDKVPGGANANVIAEVDPASGAVLNSFQIASQFSVNYGDIDVVRASGNLIVVSSDESRIAEFTPTGTLVRYLPLPAGVGSLSGIGYDDSRSQFWVTSTSGTIWQMRDAP
jgi:hypothetical protein